MFSVVPRYDNSCRDRLASAALVAKEWEQRHGHGHALQLTLASHAAISLEHTGETPPGRIVNLCVDDVDVAVSALGVTVINDMARARAFEVADPDGHRLRIGTPTRLESQPKGHRAPAHPSPIGDGGDLDCGGVALVIRTSPVSGFRSPTRLGVLFACST